MAWNESSQAWFQVAVLARTDR